MTDHRKRMQKRIEIREKHQAGITIDDIARAYKFMRIRRIRNLSKGR